MTMKVLQKAALTGGNKDTRLKKCIRIFPHHMEGEGHFLALMKKKWMFCFQ